VTRENAVRPFAFKDTEVAAYNCEHKQTRGLEIVLLIRKKTASRGGLGATGRKTAKCVCRVQTLNGTERKKIEVWKKTTDQKKKKSARGSELTTITRTGRGTSKVPKAEQGWNWDQRSE